MACLLLENLKVLKCELKLLTSDESNDITAFQSSNSESFIQNYLNRRKSRKEWLKNKSSNRNKKNALIYKFGFHLIRFLNDSDKKCTKIRIKLSKQCSFLRSHVISLRNFNSWDILIFSRAYLIPLVLIKSFINQKRNSKIVYYPYELYGNQFGHNYSHVIKLLELLFLKYSKTLLITQNAYRSSYYRELGYKKHIFEVRNYKNANVQWSNQSRIREIDSIRLIWLGSVGNGRNIEEILKLITRKEMDISLTVFGYIPKNWRLINREIIELATRMNRLSLNEEVELVSLKDSLYNFDAGLILYDKSCLNHLYCAPAKLTDYLHAGLPIIANSLPAMEYYSSKFPFVQLFDEKSEISFIYALEKLRRFWTREGKATIVQNSRELTWDNEFRKIKSIFS